MTEGWKAGDRLVHRFNAELGPGRVVEVSGRTLLVEFPAAGTTLTLAAGTDAIAPLELTAGTVARLVDPRRPEAPGEIVTIASPPEEGRCRLTDGRSVGAESLWPLQTGVPPLERLAAGEIDTIEDFANRLDALHLAAVREADGLGSFLGGRIRLFPHQLHVAERATRSDPVRWLLADEVGLGKTVEACLILNHLIRTGRAESALVVAPETLTVQWLGELWRKYHQVFALLDAKRLADVERDFGAGFNPFDVHRRAVIGLATLAANPPLTRQAVEAGVDLLIVDEAHHLRRPPGHPGDPAYRAVAPIAALGRHTLLLTATPLEDDAHGFFRLLQLLRPEEFPGEEAIERRIERLQGPGGGDPLPPCTSSTRRADVGGLPPRRPAPAEPDDEAGWAALEALERAAAALPAENAAQRRVKADRIRRALESGAALEAVLAPEQTGLKKLARKAQGADPRIAWIARSARRWSRKGEKTLIFVASRETLTALRTALESAGGFRVGVFHEDLSPGQRDIEVAQFRLEGGPSVLISTECGGEGRNFEFCARLVLFDLPWNPAVVEQRIGRLDRIGRKIPVEIVFFRPPGGVGRAVARLYEAIGLFEAPLAGIERELGHVEEAIERVALEGAASSGAEPGALEPEALFAGVVGEAREARGRVQEAAWRELHRDPYRPAMAKEILARVPPGLDGLTQETVLAACERLGFHVEPHRDETVWSVEFGNRALVDSLPGVPGGSNFLGTFEREEAVADETIDYFASGHTLVEGLIAEMDDSPRGRVALLDAALPDPPPPGAGTGPIGLLAIYRDGPRFEAVALDGAGRPRPDWAEALTRRPLRTRRVRVEAWTGEPGWAETIARLAERLDPARRPVAVAAFRIR